LLLLLAGKLAAAARPPADPATPLGVLVEAHQLDGVVLAGGAAHKPLGLLLLFNALRLWPTSASVSPVAAGVSAGVAGVLEAASSVAVLPVLPVPVPLISQDAPTANAAAGLSYPRRERGRKGEACPPVPVLGEPVRGRAGLRHVAARAEAAPLGAQHQVVPLLP
ncbi:unnamed protein product, partial [Ixodes pacificus]